jgi:vitamin B12/bleomycin/antimicrobial peptide transport system ATP-binding/permease protein
MFFHLAIIPPGPLTRRYGVCITYLRNARFLRGGQHGRLVPILPVLIVAPMYLHGDVEFGVVTQAAMAFAQLLGALVKRARSA